MSAFSKLKLCFLAGTLEHGGAERQLFYIVRELQKYGAALKVLCLDRGEIWEQPIRSLNIPVVWVGQRKSRFSRFFRIIKELQSERFEVVQSQHFFANAYIGLAARVLGLRGIGAMRSDMHLELRVNGPVASRLNLRLPEIIAANSRAAIKQVIAQGMSGSRFYFLPNVVDTEHFKPATTPPHQPIVLMASGRLVQLKRFDRMISIIARLRKHLKLDVRGLIVGPPQDTNLLDELERQCASLALTREHVRFVGGVADMVPYYQRAAIFVLTSDFEGTPNVVLEAMATGLPVISTNVPGTQQIIEDGRTGFLRNRDDLEGMVDVAAKLVADPSLRQKIGRQAREYVEQTHSIHSLSSYLAGLYDMAVPGRQN